MANSLEIGDNEPMKSRGSWLEVLRILYLYIRLRQRKGLMGPDFAVRGFRFAAARLLGPHRAHGRSPLIATVAVTSRCPLECHHCSEGYQDGYELPADVILRTLDELVTLGCPVIALTGGEPFSRPELVDFLDRIPSSVTALIFTSGIGLTESLSAALVRRRNLLVCFSLDHSDPQEHDRLRGREGSHAAVMRGIERLGNGRPEVHVSTLVMRGRLSGGELPGFIRSLKRHGVSCVQLFQPRPVGRLARRFDLCLGPEEEARLFQIALDLNRDPDAPLVVAYPAVEHPEMLGCCGGYARVHVDSHGHVCTCDFAPLSFGLVTEEPFTAIWERMRTFFETPGNRCLVRDNPEIFGIERQARNVLFSNLSEPQRLRSPAAGVFERSGEGVYRLLASSLTLAAVAAGEWEG